MKRAAQNDPFWTGFIYGATVIFLAWLFVVALAGLI